MINNNSIDATIPLRAEGWNTEAARPYHALFDLPLTMTRSPSGDGSYYAVTAKGPIWLTVVGEDHVAVSRTESTVDGNGHKFTIFGDVASDAHWYPFQPLYDQFEFGEAPPEEIDLTVVCKRMATLSQHVRFLDSDPAGTSAHPITQTVMAYLRLKTLAEGDLMLFLSETVEVHFDAYDLESGSFIVEPNETYLGPTEPSAVPMYSDTDPARFWLRPAVMTFGEGPAAFQPAAVEELADRLTALGYLSSDRSHLDNLVTDVIAYMDE